MAGRIAIIPARGGSKRIPKKNIRTFCNKPIIAYSIEEALASELFDKVIVSTDDIEIAKVANSYGAETPFIRPAEISDDYTGTNAVVKHAIKWFIESGQSIELACCIYATSPFLKKNYLQEGYNKLINSDKSYTFSVTSYPFPIQRSVRINGCGEVEAFWPEYINTRSQDLEEAYHDAGQFYWGRSEAFLNDVVTFSSASLPVILPRYLVQDIDTLEDWKRAELMYKTMQLMEAKNLE